MNQNLWIQIHQREVFSLPSQAPSQRMDQSFIKITTKTDENEQELHVVVTAVTT